MKLLSTAVSLLLAGAVGAFDLNTRGSFSVGKSSFASNNQILSQKEITKMATTRRETIKMPSQTPMVPWTVRIYSAVVCRISYNVRCEGCFPEFGNDAFIPSHTSSIFRLPFYLASWWSGSSVRGFVFGHVPRPHLDDQQVY